MPRVPMRACLAAALALCAGCGGGDAPSGASRGAAVFADAGCGDCHALADAGARGTRGPDLDEVRLDRGRVFAQVTRGGGGMPAFDRRLTYRQIEDVAEYVARVSGRRATSSAKAFAPDRTKLDECGTGDGGCIRQAFGNLAYDRGPERALDRFAEAVRADPAVERACHPTAHTIGAAALLRFDGDAGKALAAGAATCGSGYYHGVLESKLAAVSQRELASTARSVCSSAGARSSHFVYYQCVHGLGHGLMLYTRNHLPRALDTCHRLATSFDQISCSGGVFMENQQPSYGAPSRWLRDRDLLYPCNSRVVEVRDKLYCYLMVTSQILPRVGRDWRRTAAWCRRSDRRFVRICFQSYGRDASGAARQDPGRVRQTCRRAGPDGEGECVFGAVRDILNNEATDLRARRLCETVARRHRGYCFYGLGSILGAVHRTRGERDRACRRFAAGADLADCLRGAVTVTWSRG